MITVRGVPDFETNVRAGAFAPGNGPTDAWTPRRFRTHAVCGARSVQE